MGRQSRSKSVKCAQSLESYSLELVLARGYAELYPNFDGGTSFAVQHVESVTAEMQTETPLVEWEEFFEQIDQGILAWQGGRRKTWRMKAIP